MHLRAVSLLLFALISCLGARGFADPTFAERLGYPEGSRVVIFHGDDAGLSHGTNTGTIEAIEKGVLSSVSVMMPTPWVPEIVDYVKAHPNVDFGLHLTLTSEWDHYRWGPVAGKPKVPGLVDSEGAMWHGVGEVQKHATPDEIETEIRAQIDRADTMGFKYTHMDSHMGTLFSSLAYFQRYMKVGIEKKIPLLMAGGHATYASVENPDAVKLLRVMSEVVWKAGLPVLDDIHTASYGWKNKAQKKANYIKFLRTMKPGVTEVIMHCIHDTPEFPPISDSGDVRHGDFLAMTDPELRKVIEEEKIIITTWRELMERRQKVK